MRLGFVSQLESRMGSYEGGVSLADVSDPVNELSERLYAAGQTPVMFLPEVMIAPYNIFRPGTFFRRAGEGTGVASKLGKGARFALGTAPGRAGVGATIGAAAGTATGDDGGDIARSAAIGAGAAAIAPAAGRLLMRENVPGAIKAAALSAGAGALLGDSPDDAAWGAAAGIGLFGVSPTVRRILSERLPSINRAIRASGRGLDLMSFRPIADQHEPAMAVHVGMVAHLETGITTAATAEEAAAMRGRLNQWNTNVRMSGVKHALAEEMRLATGNEIADEVAAATIVWANTLLGIDHIASTQAKSLTGGAWRGRWHFARNKLVNQIRPFAATDDVGTDAWFDDLSMAMAMTEAGQAASRRELLSRAGTIRARLVADPEQAARLAAAHDKTAVETLTQLWRPENMPKPDPNAPFDPGMEAPGIPGMAGLGAEGRALLMQKYMPQIWDKFGNWPKFTASTDSVRRSRASGLLDPAELIPAKTRTGRRSHITDVTRRDRATRAVNEAMTESALTEKGDGVWDAATSVLAPGVLPGRMTIADLATKSGQEIFELREEVSDLLDARKHLERLDRLAGGAGQRVERLLPRSVEMPQSPDWRSVMRDVGIEDLTPQQIGHLVRETFHPSTVDEGGRMVSRSFPGEDSMIYIVKFAKRKGVSVDQLTSYINDEAVKLADDAARWDEYGLPLSMADENGRTLTGFDALKKRSKDLHERWQYAAKEVDVKKLAADYRAAGRMADADEVETLAAALQADNYKLMHGVEFAMPEDLALVPGGIWADINRKHMNYATLGNFFKGRLPAEGHIIADLRHRAALVRELSELKDSTLSGVRTDSEEVDGILDFLQRWVRADQDRVEDLTRHMDLGSVTRRTVQRVTTSMTPVNVEDVQSRGKEIRNALMKEAGFSDSEARAIVRATAKFRNGTFKDMGLYAFEAKARSGNQAAWALKTLSGAKYGEGFLARGRGQRALGATAGAIAGSQAEAEGDTFENRLAKVVLGGAAGAAVGTVAPNVLKKVADPLASAARDWRYGYLADNLARARDSLRFTISPIFDASRYTEGMMLAQTGAPMRYTREVKDAAGQVVHKVGDRVILPGNMTPRALKKKIGVEAYERRIGQFQKFSRDRQDFDPEALDSTGRWFKQVGILGFSPVDWMGTAFARLMGEGFNADEAYDATRRMYTYATGKGVGRARSAAEMSVNFMFFPFSFQKKAMSHLAKWMNDDLGRSIMLHDAFKTYELLDEQFNLEDRWRDYFPWIQQLQRLNLFAYGLSMGRFGGINSQMFETGGKLAWNMFVPVGMKIETDNAEEVKALTRNLLPVLNDINWMSRNLHEQANVISSPAHVTRASERSKGWEEWNQFKADFDAQLRERGYTLEDIHNKPWLSDALAFYEDKRTELQRKYPAWWESRNETIGNIMAEEQERNDAIDRFATDTRAGIAPSMDDAMINEFETVLAEIKDRLRLTAGITSLEDAPPEVMDMIRKMAVGFAQQNPRWVSIWERFYLKSFGPLTVERRL